MTDKPPKSSHEPASSLEIMKLTSLAFGGWTCQVLFSLQRLGVHDALASGSRSLEAVEQAIGVKKKGVRRLLNAGVALQLLRLDDGAYANTPLSQRYLTTSSETSLAHWVAVMERWARAWAELTECITDDRACESDAALLGADAAYQETFLRGMHEYARLSAEDFAALVDVPEESVVLDVGGGLGTYSIALCRRHPSLSAVVCDLPGALALAETVIREQGMSNRITLRACNYETDEFGPAADIVLLSNVLHQENAETAKAMLRKAHRALKTSGKVIVQSLFLNENETSPLFSTLHSLSALVIWGSGESYRAAQVRQFLLDVGFSEPAYAERGASKLIQAIKA